MSNAETRGLGNVLGPRGVLLGTFLMGLFGAGVQIMPASVLTLVMADLDIGPSAAGWLVSATLLTPALLSLPMGLVLDRVDNRHVLLGGTAILVTGNLWSWSAATSGAFISLVLSRVLVGAGIVALWTGGANLIGASFSGRNSATATGIFTASAPLGYVLAQGSAPVVTSLSQWETNFLLYAAASASAYALFATVSYRTARVQTNGEQASIADFVRVLRDRAVWLVALMSFVSYSLNLFFNSWMPTYLTEEFGFELAQSGLLIAVFPAMGVLSRTSGGIISDRLLDERRRPVPIFAFLVTVPLVAGMLLANTAVVIASLLVFSGYFVQLGIGLYYTYVREIVSTNVTGSAIAVLSTMSFVGGFTAPLAAGILIEATGTYYVAFAFAGGLAVLGVVFAVLAPEPVSRQSR